MAASGEEIEITKRGRPVARLVAASEPPALTGSVSYLVEDDELIAPIEADLGGGRLRWSSSTLMSGSGWWTIPRA